MNFFNICQSPRKSSGQMLKQPNQFSMNRQEESPIKVLKSSSSKHIVQSSQFIIQCKSYHKNAELTGQATIIHSATKKKVFEGMLVNGRRNGYGRQYNNDMELMYEGQFFNNQKNGWGKTPNYEGQFKNNLYDGYGRLISQNQFYEGYFMNGFYAGIGIYMKANTEFKKQTREKIWGIDKIDQFIEEKIEKSPQVLFVQYDLEEVFIGQWMNNLKNGGGKVWKQNNYWYSGQFSHGIYHGIGTLHTSMGQILRGAFRKGQLSK